MTSESDGKKLPNFDRLGTPVDLGAEIDDRLPDSWGPWCLNRDNLTLGFYPNGSKRMLWEVDLEECKTKDAILGWIFSFASKEYSEQLDPTPDKSLASLCRALLEIFFYHDPHGPGPETRPEALRR